MEQTKDRIDVAIAWNGRAVDAVERGADRAAERWSRAACRLMRGEVGAGHPDTVHLANTMSRIVEVRGQLAEAETIARASVDAMAAINVDLEPVHRIRLESQTRLGDVLRALGRYREAEPVLRAALSDATARFGAHDNQTSTLLNELAIVLKYTRHRASIIDAADTGPTCAGTCRDCP